MNPLVPFLFDRLMHPWFLVLLGAVAALCAAECFAGRPAAFSIPAGEAVARIAPGRAARLRWLPPVLRLIGLAMLVVALARPLHGLRPKRDTAWVVDIMLCVDVSGSMQVMDFVEGNARQSRLSVTKQAVREFLSNRKEDRADRFGADRVGLVLYAGYAWTQCPLTLDYAVLEHELDKAAIDESDPRKRGTAIGSAIGLAVAKLHKSEAKSKVIVLLTDGRNNRGEIDPATAAQFAREYGIRVYTIGAGSGDQVLVPQPAAGSAQPEIMSMPVDTDILEVIALSTGGRFFRATDAESLRLAYEEISRLETTEVAITDLYEYEEGFMPWAIGGALGLALSIFSRRRWFEAIP